VRPIPREYPFADRADAGRRLAERLRSVDPPLVAPVVVAIPRGGVEVGAEIARELAAPLDAVIVRKLGAADQPELAIGAIAEGGVEWLVPWANLYAYGGDPHLAAERARQGKELERRLALVRAVRPVEPLAGRDAILCDDGIATGATFHAAVEALRRRGPRSIVAAVPVAARDWIAEATRRVGERGWPDRMVCLERPEDLGAVGLAYRDFPQVDDARAARLLAGDPRSAHSSPSTTAG